MPSGVRGRRRRMEPTRATLGAWDDPQVSLFATVPQEPLADMLDRLKEVPVTGRDRMKQMDACPLMMIQSASTNRLYREIKYQVAQIADDRNRNYNPITERERQSALIASMMAEHNRREFAEAMRRKQLSTNVQRIRDLRIELERAKTSISVANQRSGNMANRNSERVHEINEAIEDRKRAQLEKEAEQLALHKKAHDFSDQLVEQIRTLQSARAKQEQTDREEGRLKRHRDEQAYAQHLQQAVEWRHEKRKELKQMLDEFAELQRRLRAEQEERDKEKLKQNVIVTEALGSVTRDFQIKKQQQKIDGIERRRLIAAQLGKELCELKRKQDAHDSMLADILACERQAREKKIAHTEIEKRAMMKQQVARDLIQQQKEQKILQEQEEEIYNKLPCDPTSFMQRQYQQAAARDEASRKINTERIKGFAIGMGHNNRAAAIEEDRLIRKALHDMEADMDLRIEEERMRLLKEQPREIIDEVRPCKLSKAERHEFNLPKCGLHDEDVPLH